MKTGMVAMWPKSSPPDGWLMCNGAPIDPMYTDLIAMIGANTPDLGNKFIRGAGATPLRQSGGFDTVSLAISNLPAHSHGGMTLVENSHVHSGTSGAMDANASHGHTTFNTGTVSADHTHVDPARNVGASTAGHTHALTVNEGVGESADGNYLDSNPTADPGMTFDGGSAANKSINHTHNIPTRNTGASPVGGDGGDHKHTLTLDSPSLAHTHGFSLAAGSLHTHTMASAGSGTAFSIVPTHTALYFVIKW
jgi:microcystin-dependent protein